MGAAPIVGRATAASARGEMRGRPLKKGPSSGRRGAKGVIVTVWGETSRRACYPPVRYQAGDDIVTLGFSRPESSDH